MEEACQQDPEGPSPGVDPEIPFPPGKISEKSPSWADRVAIPGSQKRKMQLLYHKLVATEGPLMVYPPQEVVEEGAKEWEKCLVGHLMDSKLPTPIIISIARRLCQDLGCLMCVLKAMVLFSSNSLLRKVKPKCWKAVLSCLPAVMYC